MINGQTQQIRQETTVQEKKPKKPPIKKQSSAKVRFSAVTLSEVKTLNSNEDDFSLEVCEEKKVEGDLGEEVNPFFRSDTADYDRLSIIWSNVLLIATLYNCITSTFFLGISGFPESVWLYLEFLQEISLIIDIGMRLIFIQFFPKQWNTLYLLHEDKTSHWRRFRYGITAVPTSILIYELVPKEMIGSLGIAFVRTIKLLRLNYLNHYFDVRDLTTKRNSILRSVQAIVYILLITHTLGCFWLFIGRVDPDQGNNWLQLVGYAQYDVSSIQMYVDSTFFVVSSMTGLGFGYIYPRTVLEYSMQSLLMVTGVSIYANFFAFFAVSIYNRNRKRIENMKRLEESKKLAVLRNFPIDIRSKIRFFYNNLRLRYDSLCDKFEILQELPNSLRSELSLFINSDVIQKVNFFQFADPSFILIVSKFLKPKLCLEGNYILYLGEVATHMYFIKSGIVQVLSTDNKTVVAYMSEGTYFGEIGILITQKRTCFVKAKTPCVLFTIKRCDMLDILEKFPLQDKFLRAVAKQRQLTTAPEDLIESDQEFENAAQMQISTKSKEQRRNLLQMFDITYLNSPLPGGSKKSKILKRSGERAKKRIKIYLTDDYLYVTSFMVIPFSRLFNIWSVVFCLAFVYQMFYVPFSIGTGFEIQGTAFLIDVIAMIIIIADSILRPFLAINQFGEIDTNKQNNMKNYISNYFLLDIVSSIPFDYLLLIVEGGAYVRQFIRLARLLKFYRLKELIKVVRNNTGVDEQLFRICLLFMTFLLIIHWSTCLTIFICTREYASQSRFDRKTLLGNMNTLPYNVDKLTDNTSKWKLYFNLIILCTCYMGSIMYGDIIPFTLSEELLGLVQMIIGRIFISFLFAEVSSYVTSQYSFYNNHIQQKNKIDKWMQLNNIDPLLRRRVKKYFDFKWENQKGIQEAKILKDLPRPLRVQVKNYIFHSLIHNSEVFPKDNEGAISTITAKLQRRLVPRHEFIIKQGELATEMFFLMKGEVLIVTEDGVTVATLKKYMHFGEMALIEKKASVRSVSVRASTDVVLAVLNQQDFDLICQHYHEFYDIVKEIGEQRTKDSLSKGIRISNARRSTVSNQSIAKFLQAKSSFAQHPPDVSRQLSMIEEESKLSELAPNPAINEESEGSGSPMDQGIPRMETLGNANGEDNENGAPLVEIVNTDQDDANDQATPLNVDRQLDIMDIEDGIYDDQVQIRSPSLRKSNLSPSLLSNKRQSNIMETEEIPDKIPEENEQIETLGMKRMTTIQVEKQGFIKIWEAPKLLSSVNDLNQYFKNLKGGSKMIYRRILAFFLMQTFRQALLFIIVLYNIVFIPLQMGFLIEFRGQYLFMEIMTLLIYFTDIIIIARRYINLRKQLTQITQEDPPSSGNEPSESSSAPSMFKGISDLDELKRKIMYTRLDMITSVIGIVPFSLILQFQKGPNFILNFMRVLRLVKIWPFYRVIQLLKRINVNFFRWLEVLITYYIVAHIVGCVMLSVGLTADDVRLTWLNRVPSPLPGGVRLVENLDDVTYESLYIHALYFACNTISHVAIGDLTSVSTQERILNSFIIWILVFYYAFSFANIASIVGDFLGTNFLTFHERYTAVKSMINQHKIPPSVQSKIDNYYDFLWITTQGFDEQHDIFQELPTQIKYDVMMNRFQEAIQNSLIYKNEQSQIDIPMVNSIFEVMKMRVYMSKDIIIKAGSFGMNLYLFLEGEALMYGIDEEIIHIMTSGTHYNNDLGGDLEDFQGKRICHIVAKTICVVGVIEKDQLSTLFEAYPYWQKIITRLNRSHYNKCRQSLKQCVLGQNLPESYTNEFNYVENHLTFSGDHVYENLINQMLLPQNRFIYNEQSPKYQKLDFLQHQLKAFQQETGIVHKKNFETSSEGSTVTKNTILMGSNGALEMYHNIGGGGSQKIRLCCRSLIFMHNSKANKVMDFLHLVNMIYIAISAPLIISLIDKMEIFLILEILSLVISLLVIIFKMRTPIIVKGGYTLDFPLIVKNYFNNGLILDLFGLLPLNLALGFYSFSYPGILGITVLRLLRMVSIKKLLQMFEKFEVYLKNLSIFMFIMKAILILFLLWHWTSCFWLYINRKIEPGLNIQSWYQTFKLAEKSIGQQYLISFYYVMKIVTGVGQSDMITYNDLERICFMLIINVGDTLFAFAFGLIASIQLHIFQNNDFQQFMEKMKQIDEFLVSIKAEKAQRQKTEQCFSYSYYTRNKIQLIETRNLVGYLPFRLQKDVIYYSLKDILEPMFKTFKSDNLIREISSVLTNVIFLPGDYIIYKDQIGEEMYFIVEGSVQIIAADKETVLKVLTKGNYFGEIAIFMHTKRISYVQAKSFVVVSVLRKQFLDDIILNFPEVAKRFSEEAEKRIQETKDLEKKKLNEGESYGDDFDNSFLKEINIKWDNCSGAQSDRSLSSLMKQIKKKSLNIDTDQFNYSSPSREDIVNQSKLMLGFDIKVEELVKKKTYINSNLGQASQEPIKEEGEDGELRGNDHILDNDEEFFSGRGLPHSDKPKEKKKSRIPKKNFQSDKDNNSSEEDEDEPPNLIQEMKLRFKNSLQENSNREALPAQFDLSSSDSDFSQSQASNSGRQTQQAQKNQPFSIFKVLKEEASRMNRPSEAISPLPTLKKQNQSHGIRLLQSPPLNKKSTQIWLDKKIIEDQNLNDLENVNQHTPIVPKHKQLKMSRTTMSKRRNTEFHSHLNPVVPSKVNKKQHMSPQGSPTDILNLKVKREPVPEELLQVQIKKGSFAEAQTEKNELSSIRRQGKKKVQRRLSKISMGKNLMLSQTAGLKLQWTVGK